MDILKNYLESIKKQFLYYKTLGEKAMNQIDEAQLFISQNENSNSIAVIIKHLHGNMLSRWTDFLTADGEKPSRGRDNEFENDINDKEHLLQLWQEGWNCFFDAINSLNTDQLSQTIFIRGEAHTILEAINRQLAHYPYHVGQMVFAAKQIKTAEWNSLSIPKKKS